MRFTRRSCLLLPLLAVGACETREAEGAGWTQTQADQIRRAGEQLGIPVRTDRMVHFAQGGATFFTAPAESLETVPAAALPRGVNLGVAYLDIPGDSLAAGFYGLQVFADPRQVGTVAGRLQWIGADGKVAAEVPATVNLRSLAPPERTATPSTITLSAPCPSDTENVPPGCVGPYRVCYTSWIGTYCFWRCIALPIDNTSDDNPN
jgi:hypothetical protein